MSKFRVYYMMPSYSYIIVDATDEVEAREKADIHLADMIDCGQPLEWEIDWDAGEEFAFVVQE